MGSFCAVIEAIVAFVVALSPKHLHHCWCVVSFVVEDEQIELVVEPVAVVAWHDVPDGVDIMQLQCSFSYLHLQEIRYRV